MAITHITKKRVIWNCFDLHDTSWWFIDL